MRKPSWWVSLLKGEQALPIDLHAHSRVYASAIDETFSPQGFERVDKRRWVNSSNKPLRQVIKLEAIRGASDVMTWGASFDFAPVADTDTGKISWCRTPKTAKQMLVYDPINYWDSEGRDKCRVSAFSSTQENDAVTARSFYSASEWFAKVNSIEDAVVEFEEWQRRPFIRLGYRSYVLAPLAYAFCLARVNKAGEALVVFQSWIKDKEVTDTQFINKLKTLLLDARQLS